MTAKNYMRTPEGKVKALLDKKAKEINKANEVKFRLPIFKGILLSVFNFGK